MTVCIGAICYWHPNDSAVVLASDRMVTTGGDFIQYEHDIPKIVHLTPKICVMIAGSTVSATKLTQRLAAKFRDGAKSVEEVAGVAKVLYENLRRDQINSEIFHPRGITMEQFYSDGLQSRFQPHLVDVIDDRVMGFDYSVELLIVGTDSTGAHLYTVSNPGIVENYDQIGYVAIGNGGIHATQSLIGAGHSGLHALFETLFTVYASKRRSESAPGVGRLTDMVIIPPDERHGETEKIYAVWLDEKQKASLEQLYNEFRQPQADEINKKVNELNLFGAEQSNEAHDKTAQGCSMEEPSTSST